MSWIDYSRLLLAVLIAFLVWTGLSGLLQGCDQGQENWPTGERPANVTGRGGARPVSGGLPGLDVLAVRPLVPSPTLVPVPAAAPRPTPEPSAAIENRLEPLGHFRVTAYSDSVLNGTDGCGITRSGQRTRWGVVAVDPRVIPLGSRLMIEGMEPMEFVALDTGGGVIGRWVDIWFETDLQALEHGVKERDVYLVR